GVVVYSIAVQADGKILVGGNFSSIGGQARYLFARLSNDTVALQSLAVSQSSVAWTRGGSSAQFTRVTFESSPDNVTYTSLGSGTLAGSNWTLTGLSLPTGQNIYIRARGYCRGGALNGSESIQESVRNAFLASPVTLVWNGSTSPDWHTALNWTPNAVPTTFNDVLIPTAGVTNQPTISAGSSSINAMTIQSGRVLTINSSLLLSTAADVINAGTITGAGKLAFGGVTFTQNGSVSVASVEFPAGVHALTGGGTFASGIVTVQGGASVILTSNHTLSALAINSGGSFDAATQTLTLTGAGMPIFNGGSFR